MCKWDECTLRDESEYEIRFRESGKTVGGLCKRGRFAGGQALRT